MSYITIDKGICAKPKFRKIARMTGLEDHVLLGYLCRIWIIADEIGHDLEGDDEDISSALSAPSALLCALCAVGWAERTSSGIYLNSNDPKSARIEEQRAQAKRDRARRSYERRMGIVHDESALKSAPVCASAPPPPLPPSLSSPPLQPLPKAQSREVEEAIAQHAGPNSSLNHTLSRDAVVTETWDAIPRRWRKERGLNLAKLAAAIQSEQEQRGCSRTDAARIVGDAIAAYCRSPEGEGRYMRSLGRWLDAEGWREDPESWSVRRGGDGPKGKTLLEVSEELETENRQ